MVCHALDSLHPNVVLVEGPPEAADVLSLAARAEMAAPVALLIYEPDAPRNAVYYPFAEFSPEWQAIKWALSHEVPVHFIDLPIGNRAKITEADGPSAAAPADGSDADGSDAGESAEPTEENEASIRRDSLDQLAMAAGFADGEAWWGKLIEERRGDEDPMAVFAAIHDAMSAARAEHPAALRDVDEPAREAHMRKCIRATIKEGHDRIAVICGAWHAPVLTTEALAQTPIKSDNETLKGLPKRKTAATWIPWTYDRLSMWSGYGAGVASPGWYEHLWLHHDRLSERWLTRVARLMRDEDLNASPASVIESVRLAESLASLRGRSLASLDELTEATLTVLCHGNPWPLRVIEQKLIVGQRLGTVPEEAPAVPLQRDLTALQKSLRMKVSAEDQLLDLDQRKETDLARSRLLHRLRILRIDWGTPEDARRRARGSFHELWRLQWRPELAIAVMEAARWGNTVEQAAGAFITSRVAGAKELAKLTALLDDVMLADLPQAVEKLVGRIEEVTAIGEDVGHLMDALPPLARILRYGNVRKTDAAMVEPLITSLLARIGAGILPACASLGDDAARIMRDRIEGVHSALCTLDRADLLDEWKLRVLAVADSDIHGLVAARCWRLLHESGDAEPDEVARRLALALSPGNDPAAASAWLEGFLAGSGSVLVHDLRLLGIVDRWVCSLRRDTFDQVCPIARRTFSTFQTPERRRIGEHIRKQSSGQGEHRAESGDHDGYSPERGALVEPVLRLILGESYP